MNMLTAADARKITETANSRNFEEVLQRTINIISHAAKQGKCSTNICINALITTAPWRDEDNEILINYLQELGYKIQEVHKTDLYLYFVTVSW